MRMKSKSSKIFSGLLALVLALTMMVGVMPMNLTASAADASHTVDAATATERTMQLANALVDKYFTTTQSSCGNSYCSQCKNTNIIKTDWLKNTMGLVPDSIDLTPGHFQSYSGEVYPTAYSCAGFANYCLWYIYAQNSSDNVRKYKIYSGTFTKSEMDSSGVRTGDVIRVGRTVGDNQNYHSFIYISHNNSGVTVLDSNFGNSNHNLVRKHVIEWSWRSGQTMAITRGKNWTDGGSTPSHTHSYTSAVTAPTCTSQGYTTHTCSCGDSYTDSYVPALGHSDGAWVTTVEPTCLGEGTEKIYCTRCNVELNSRQIAPLGHDYASEVVTEATCKGKGQMKYVCKRCEFTYYDVIPAKGHNHEEAIWVTTVAPTCTASGEQSAYCPDCNELIETRAVEALGHDDGKWVITSQPGCESKGEETCYCTRCGKVIDSRPIDALGHDDGTWVVVTKPTCREDGQEVLFCTRCGKAIDKRTVNALGHDEGVWKIDFEPTANHDGQMSRYCTRCDEVLETKSFKMHTHREGYRETVTEATCTTDGIGGIFCADCGAKYDTYVISALGHDYNDWYMNNNGTHSRTCSRCHNFESENCDFEVTVKEATCTEAGYTTHVCKICGYTYVDGNVDALGHAWGEWVDDGNGETHTRTCSGCGITETEEHHWGEWKLNKDATLFKNGTKTRVCPDCGATETIGSIHTAWLVRIPYTIVLWIGNILKKVLYILSFQWFLPNHGIPPIH